jgi:hypothetical protein
MLSPVSDCSRALTQVARALVLVALTAGCDTFRKAKECSALSKTVSEWMAETPAPDLAVSAPERVAKDARATARRYEELDRRLAALNVQSDELIAHVARYRDMTTGAARVLDEVALALEQQNAELARRRRVEFDGTVKAERELVAQINAACRK